MPNPVPQIPVHDDDVFLTRRGAAAYLRRSVPTLERWTANGEGPPVAKIGGKCLYHLPALRRFARSGSQQTA